jgi:putative nucleotidyltransferase with HDIG domain
MKLIKDVIHDFIEVYPEELRIIDSWIFQRLRYIRQLGTSYLVYPGANHTRFEHSLGVMYLAGKIYRHLCQQLGACSKEELLKLRLAGLLHDIGHLAFSHCLENTLVKANHETVGVEIIKNSEIGDILQDLGYSRQEIVNLIQGKGKLSQIISSQVDADRLDYLVRDAYHAGTNYGLISINRIISSMKLSPGEKLIFSKKGLIALENFLIARYQMYFTVYLHHTSVFFSQLLKKIFARMQELGMFEPYSLSQLDKILQLTDDYVLQLLKKAYKETTDSVLKELIERFFKRRPYKMIVERYYYQDISAKIDRLRKKIYEEFSEYDVFVSFPRFEIYSYNPKIKKKSIMIETNGQVKDIFNVSMLIHRIANAPYYIFRVYINPEKVTQEQIDKIKSWIRKL